MPKHPSDDNVVHLPVPPPSPDQVQVEALAQMFTGWFIHRAEYGGLEARWKSESGVKIHVVCADNAADMHRRLQVIEDARANSQEPA